MFEIEDLRAGYGSIEVLHGISISLDRGRTLGIFGRNGAGKTTLANAILGIVNVTHGDIRLNGQSLRGMKTHRIVRRGIGLAPQEGGTFVGGTVLENLQLGVHGLRLSAGECDRRVAEMLNLFPSLADRREAFADSLSGGERRMLAVARALIRRPSVLVLDEPSIGLAPAVVDEIARVIEELKRAGQDILITEQSVGWVLGVADVIAILDGGRLVETVDCERDGWRPGVEYVVSRYLGTDSPTG